MTTITPPCYLAARESAVVFDRSTRGKIEAVGTESAVFLHNLSTNDIKGLVPLTGCEGFFCTATAKVIVHAWIWRYPPEGKSDTFWLDVPAGMDEKVYAHLDRYLISEDVTLTNRTDAWCQFHLAGPKAQSVLSALGIEVPTWQRGRLTVRETLIIREVDSLGMPGYDLLTSTDKEDLRNRLIGSGAAEGDSQTWEVLRIEAGQPQYGIDMDENTFAPEVGPKRVAQTISYNKGCYLGQEPIVMARDRGVVQRAILGLGVGPEPVPAGSLLFREDKEIGRVTSSVWSPACNQAVALAFIRRGNQNPGTVVEVDVNGTRRPAEVKALPMVG